MIYSILQRLQYSVRKLARLYLLVWIRIVNNTHPDGTAIKLVVLTGLYDRKIGYHSVKNVRDILRRNVPY
jgi:hypothetical protein